jgi:DNA N-6-adenine-methyltransferase (Dam)
VPSSALTLAPVTGSVVTDAERLVELESVIEHSYLAEGAALGEINSQRLCRATHRTFEDYCQERWGISRSYAYRKMDAAKQAALSPIGDIPKNEYQARVARQAPPHQTQGTGNNEWFTPAALTDAARRVMGTIDLDPASCAEANESVRATTYYTKEDDGLAQPWAGTIWMNPPYAKGLIGKFSTKVRDEFAYGNISQAIVLVNNATETVWFDTLSEHFSIRCEPKPRVHFWGPDSPTLTSGLQGQMIVYLGPNRDAFAREFEQFGRVVIPWTR